MNIIWIPILLLPLQIYVDVSTSMFNYHRLPWNFPTFWLKHWIPYIMLTLMQRPQFRWQKLFSWKLWIWPTTVFFALALSLSAGPNRIHVDAGFWQFRFQWIGIATWVALFIVQLFLYEDKIGSVQAFAASYFGLLLASTLYELPMLTDDLNVFYGPKFFLSSLGFISVMLLNKEKLRIKNRLLLISFVLLFLNYIFFFELPFWVPRLSVFPLFLVFPFCLK